MKVAVLCVLFASVVLGSPLKSHTNGKSTISYLVDHYYNAFAQNTPSGTYTGSKTILGQTIKLSVTFSGSELSFDVSGAISVSCDDEAYTYANGVVSITNIGKAGDCLHDALEDVGVTYQSLTYDAASDQLKASLKYTFFDISITLSHTGNHASVSRLEASPVSIAELSDKYLHVFMLQNPAGTYYGGKSILGETIDATITIVNATAFNFSLSGAISLACAFEDYTYSNGVVTVTNKDKAGDCIHDDLADNDVTLVSVIYDPTADHITVNVKYAFLPISLELDHQSTRLTPLPAKQPTRLGDLVDKYYPVYALQNPAGSYEGVKSVLGIKVDTIVQIQSATSLAFTVSGPISLSCSGEAYTYSNGVISITNIGTAGDCVHDALKANGCSLESIVYDTSSDEILVKIKYSLITISLELDHKTTHQLSPAPLPSLPAGAFAHLLEVYYPVVALQAPSGTYEGKKSILGVNVDCKTITRGDNAFDFYLTGPMTISCSSEAMSYSNGVITVTNIGKAGDCMHDALQENSVTLESIKYDTVADHITLSIKYSFVPITLELDHVSRF